MFLAAQDNRTYYSAPSSFHSIANVTGPNFGWSGITQNLTQHAWTAPLVSNVIFKGQLYPVHLTGPDAMVVFRFDLSYWDSAKTPTRMYFVFHNSSFAGINPAFGIQNDTDTLVFDTAGTNRLTPNHWNFLDW